MMRLQSFGFNAIIATKQLLANFIIIVTIYILPFFIKAVVFHNVGLLRMIKTKEKYKFAVDEHYIEWCTGGPFFNQKIY